MNPRAIAKAVSTGGSHSFGLPPDMLDESVRRLGWAALTYSVCYLVVHVAYRFSTHGDAWDHRFYDVLLAVALVSGLGLFTLTRFRTLAPQRVLALGLGFEVVSSLFIALSEHQENYLPGEMIRGFSALAAWIPTFSLLVPAGRLPTALAAFTSAAMGPLALWLQVSINGVAPPLARNFPVLFVPPFLMAAAAVILSQTMYRLGIRVSREREMGSYRLVDKIGAGGMGEVWRAEHRLLAREAAIKLIAPAARGESLAVVRQRFEREARAIAALESPHTVTLFDYGVTDDGSLYYVMELLRGFDLEDLVNRFGPLPPARAAYLLSQMCASLAEAHAAGLTHRDIKPRNTLVCRLGTECDFVKVLDFGLVKDLSHQGDAQLTHPEVTTGTPAYMAPEVALGKSFDGRADLYSLGCTGYWLLTGRLVFESKSTTAMLMDHVNQQPEPPSRRVETPVPQGLDDLILHCLAKDPAARPRSAGEIRQRLSEWAGNWSREEAAHWWVAHQPERIALSAQAATAAGDSTI